MNSLVTFFFLFFLLLSELSFATCASMMASSPKWSVENLLAPRESILIDTSVIRGLGPLKQVVSELMEITNLLLDRLSRPQDDARSELLNRVDMALSEMTINAVVWGNNWGKTGQFVRITFEHWITGPPKAHFLKAVIKDEGMGFDPKHNPFAFNPDQVNPIQHFRMREMRQEREGSSVAGGYGIQLTKKLWTDKFSYNEKGNEATLVWQLPN